MGLVFIDFEASALRSGYPIEVAWCAEDLAAGGSWLIKPEAYWREDLVWDEVAEDVHGLTLADLERHGMAARDVAAALHARLRDATAVLSDAPSYDGRWMRQLYETAGLETRGSLADADGVIAALGYRHGWRADLLEQARQRVADAAGLRFHRALDDAVWLAIAVVLARGMPEAEAVTRAAGVLAANQRRLSVAGMT